MPRVESQVAMEEEESPGNITDKAATVRFFSGNCPDPKCQTRLYCMSSYQSIECTRCGQLHSQSALQNMKEEKGDVYNTALFAIKSLIAGVKPEPGTDNIKVHGLSNYLCKLLSHLLSRYGMDKTSGRAKHLTEMGQPEIFDCGVLCDRAFCIDPEHLNIIGYGRDRSGSDEYLAGTLKVAQENNGDEERLIPIHADGDGHCLVHAISRALVGRELFWHPLRLNLVNHLRNNLERYKDMFKNFVDVDEWEDIISECDPDYVPREGETAGLRNIHIFGLANVLKRPIILLDCLSGIRSSGDYSCVFLPVLLSPDQCKNKDGVLNLPLCIAWSNQGRNHFIPLVGVKDKPCPRLPRYMLQATWGVHDSELDRYIAFDDQGCCIIGGSRPLHENYIHRLVSAMERVFQDTYKVHPTLVADVHQYIFRAKGFVGVTLKMVTEKTYELVSNKALVRCLRCFSLTALEVKEKMLIKGGQLYELAIREVGELNSSKVYTFTDYRITCRYDAENDVLIPDINQLACPFCQCELKFRYVHGDGSTEYHEGDITLEPAGPNARCNCGYKHYYNGKFYDNRPREIPVPMEWGGKSRTDVVQWWENESDPQLNSNVYQVAQDLVQKHFPGEFGSERLQQKIVAVILMLTATKDEDTDSCENNAGNPKWNAEEASKIILSGYQTQGIHKEELTKSETERQVKKQLEANAPLQQSKKSAPEASALPASGSKRNSPIRSAVTKTRASSARSSTSSAPSTPPSTPSHQAEASTPPPTPKATSKEKKIRVVAPGRSETVTLTEDVTFAQLQQLVFNATQIPAEHQKLRLGFPPKVLTAPALGEEDKIVPLNHGDKINVENTTAETQGAVKDQSGPSAWSSPRSSVMGHVDARMPNEEALLNALSARHSEKTDSQIQSFDYDLMDPWNQSSEYGSKHPWRKRSNEKCPVIHNPVDVLSRCITDVEWSNALKNPESFKIGGYFYLCFFNQHKCWGVPADNGKHGTLHPFPEELVFTYNHDMDRLELCLDNLGHFEVEADVEKKARERLRMGRRHGNQPHTSSAQSSSGGEHRREESGVTGFGSSGAITKSFTSQRAFAGQGHSLRDTPVEDKMPEDVPLTESIHGAARRLQDFCDPEHNRSSIEEEPEKMEAETKGSVTEGSEDGYLMPKYTRKGPGFSVLEPPPPPVETTDAVKQLFQNFENVVDNVQMDSSEEGEEPVAEVMDSQPADEND